MPMPASATNEAATSPTGPATHARTSRPMPASSIASAVVRSRPSRASMRGVATANTANAAGASVPRIAATVVPKRSDSPTDASSGVSEVTAVRRLNAASTSAASANRRPRQEWRTVIRGVPCDGRERGRGTLLSTIAAHVDVHPPDRCVPRHPRCAAISRRRPRPRGRAPRCRSSSSSSSPRRRDAPARRPATSARSAGGA